MENPSLPDTEFLTTEYPSAVDMSTGDHDMEFYTGFENNKLTQLTSASVLPVFPILPNVEQFAANFSPLDQGKVSDIVTEGTLFDEFISLVDGSQRNSDENDWRTDRSYSYPPMTANPAMRGARSYPCTTPSTATSTQQSMFLGEQDNIYPGNSKSTIHMAVKSQTSNQNFQKPKDTRNQQGAGCDRFLLDQLQGTMCSTESMGTPENPREAYTCQVCGNPFSAACLLESCSCQVCGKPASKCYFDACKCKNCGNPKSPKCKLGTCCKSDEVLCPRCGHELTANCLLKMCKITLITN